ncbi:U4/U6 small nuclear ribonucleoprotein [Wickerhamomyces ciferrii]|uniref:U4/U6 small nuclear ribonucleoprotein n=1 Tax=Wickerhamomyces ciferrii (strain ATCC 14091 / BCRC 22168 / CBS 111 / JCM 3599 / NBRC 0793 / NRRL Y-1031 F-60-10) TaxID=1206466 RepID=K0KJS9_WICCF|nr:U4/U6 small nuclear ribonucleoprotein [Wickerhamomyces ciferrii]CCH42402.1 U4/U6 small nuclear ribonucleoprotein [Wickerhamomyces ciferrii]
MSLNDELLKDLDSDSDFESEKEEVENVEIKELKDISSKDNSGDIPMDDVETQLNQLINSGKDVSTGDLLSRIDLSTIQDVTKISKLSHKIGPILDKIQQYKAQPVSKKEEYDFLIGVNDLSVEITNEIFLVHDFIKAHYRRRFPELESLIPNSFEYSKIVKTLGNNLDISQDELSFISKEKVLVLTMSVIQAKDNTQELSPSDLQKVIAACDLLLELDSSRREITEYVASRLSVFAPNLAAIVGSYTASQFMSVLGGLKGLSQTPSCNIPSLGNKRAVGIGFGQSGVRQQGILFYSDLIQSVDPDIRKQAMRIVSGKIILAARMDFASSVPDGSRGQKWRREIDEKIDKLQEPPENKAPKALPAPIDKPSKKRAGRKYRKMRERVQSSELRKAQNRMEFGKVENSVTDGFGEEIGLGMSGSLSGIAVNTNTNAKVSKAMKNRLEKATENSEQFNMAVLNFGNTDNAKSLENGRDGKRIKR